jgi:uncharacterized protein with FMN-binding domain
MASNQNPGRKQPMDPLLQQRLNQGGARRTGQPLPPPAPSPRGAQQGARQAQSVRPGQAPRAVINTGTDARRTIPTPGRPAAAGQAPRPTKRVKPARSAKMAALAVSVGSTAALAVAFAGTTKSSVPVVLTGGTIASSTNTAATGNTTAATTGATTASGGSTATPATTPAKSSNGIKNGTYTGQASYNRWGAVQVAAVYKGGKLVDVQVLQYPDQNGRDIEIAQYSLPILIQESVQAQSANVSGVSGASYTSYSYVQSLQSAIDAAKSASGVKG